MPPPVPRPGERYVRVNAIVMIVMTVLHFCGIGSVVMNVARFLHAHPSYPDAPFERGELAGEMLTFIAALIWALSGLVWAPLNAWGLFHRKRWARTSSLLYWGLQCLSCCCFPFGLYGLITLSRADVKELFGPSYTGPR